MEKVTLVCYSPQGTERYLGKDGTLTAFPAISWLTDADGKALVFDRDDIPDELVSLAKGAVPSFDTFEASLVYITEHPNLPCQLLISEMRRYARWGVDLSILPSDV